jgi:hypothetical protein
MKRQMPRFPLTLIAVVLAAVVLSAALIDDMDDPQLFAFEPEHVLRPTGRHDGVDHKRRNHQRNGGHDVVDFMELDTAQESEGELDEVDVIHAHGARHREQRPQPVAAPALRR